eukprot:scaffold5088_cov98-Cylindrotheca_fusiformis.AAC.12
MKHSNFQFLALLAVQCFFANDAAKTLEDGRILEGTDELNFSSNQTIYEVVDVEDSIAAGYASDLLGKAWGKKRNMTYIGGDEFVQMYDDKTETRIVLRGYMDSNVETASNGKMLIFSDRALYDIYGNIRGQTQGICAQAEHEAANYICSVSYEILDEDEPKAHVVAAFRAEGAMDLGKEKSRMTVTSGHTELDGASGTIHVAPITLNNSTDPSTPESTDGGYTFDYFFFEAVLYVSSEYLHSIMKQEDFETSR